MPPQKLHSLKAKASKFFKGEKGSNSAVSAPPTPPQTISTNLNLNTGTGTGVRQPPPRPARPSSLDLFPAAVERKGNERSSFPYTHTTPTTPPSATLPGHKSQSALQIPIQGSVHQYAPGAAPPPLAVFRHSDTPSTSGTVGTEPNTSNSSSNQNKYPLSTDPGVVMEQVRSGGPEFQFVKKVERSVGGLERPGVLWRDERGFLHWVGDV